MTGVSRGIDRIEAIFDDPHLVANAGLVVPATLMVRLGLEGLINRSVRLVGRIGGSRPGRKVLTLVATILAGGSHIDHADVLRAGATRAVLPFRVMAPSTLGTFLRAFTFGRVRQLDAVIAEALRRAWQLGAGPAGETVTIDVDSTICEVHGKQKQGAAYGYTRTLGYHPLLATCAETGEVLHARLRKGSSQRGAKRFVEELVARVRRAGAPAAMCLRADSGFWSHGLIDTLARLGVGWSITVTINRSIRAVIEAIDNDAWTPIAYPAGGEAAVTETTYTSAGAPSDAATGWWCAAAGSPTPPNRSCGPTGATTPSSPARPQIRPPPTGSPRPRPGGARHPRPQRRRRARTLPLRTVLRQCRLAGLRRARPQPHPLDHQLGGTRHGDQLTIARTLEPASSPYPAGSSTTAADPPSDPPRLALGRRVRHRPQPHPQPPANHLNAHTGPARPQTTTTR